MTTKLHLVITPNLQIIDGFLTKGNAADALIADVSGCYVIEDKGYDGNKHRENLLSNNKFL